MNVFHSFYDFRSVMNYSTIIIIQDCMCFECVCAVPLLPRAQRSDDWSCPKLNTSSGDRYSEGRQGGGREREGGKEGERKREE